MKPAPGRCVVAGNHITPGTRVVIESAFHLDALDDNVTPLRETIRRVQDMPIIGRLAAHAPGFYWSSLLDIGAGDCEWAED